VIQLRAGGRTELTYDFQRTNLCWLVVLAEGAEARLVRTPLAQSHPNECAIEAGNGRPCCSALPRGLEIAIPPLQDLERAPLPILEAANRARNY
jgi:hypothetical protein